jgi:hypothetical protein
VAIVLFVLHRITTYDYPFGILWPLYTTYQRGNQKSLIEEGQTIEEGKTIQWPQDTKGVIRSRKSRRERQYNGRFKTSDYPFGILLPLYCLSFLDFVLSIFPRFCIVCHSSIYEFWLPLLYLVAIVLSFPPDTKEVIRSRKSRKDRKYNGHNIPKG